MAVVPGTELPVQPLRNPLNEDHRQQLLTAREEMAVARDHLLRLAEAGMDVESRGNMCDATDHLANTLLKRYFAPHPMEEE